MITAFNVSRVIFVLQHVIKPQNSSNKKCNLMIDRSLSSTITLNGLRFMIGLTLGKNQWPPIQKWNYDSALRKTKYRGQHFLLTFVTRALEKVGLLVTKKVINIRQPQKCVGYWWQLKCWRCTYTYVTFWERMFIL